MRILVFSILSLALIACTEKRPVQKQQGQFNNLFKISEYHNKKHSLNTKSQFDRVNNTRSEKLTIEEGTTGINNLGLVKYTTDSELLGNDLPFRGQEQSKYEIRYLIRPENKTLVIAKVASKDLIPHDEYSYAIPDVDGVKGDKIAVPLMGYSILGYYRIERARNADNEETNTLIEVPEANFEKATHFRIDHLNKNVFQAIEGSDVYSAKYFQGEWYYAQTTVAIEEERSDQIGNTWLGRDGNFSLATKIKFIPSQSYLLGVNINVDERKGDDVLNYAKVIQIGADWRDANAFSDPGTTLLSPKDLNRFWKSDEKQLVELDFENSVTPMGKIMDRGFSILEEKKLVDLRFADDYFSFTLYHPRQEKRVKYAFRRVGNNNGYAPRKYPEKDLERFGYFNVVKDRVVNHEFHRRVDYFDNRYVSRFNPKNDEIVFHLTTSTPNDDFVLKAARMAIDFWDKAFKAAGTKIKIRLDETKRVEIGDIRYNSINMVRALRGTGLGGLGPMLSDSSTGEIISATSNVHLTGMISSRVSGVRNYIKNQLGMFDANVERLNTLDFSQFNPESKVNMSVNAPDTVNDLSASNWIKDTRHSKEWYKSERGKKTGEKLAYWDGKGPIKDAKDFDARYLEFTQHPDSMHYHPEVEMQHQIVGSKIEVGLLEQRCPEVIDYVQQLVIQKRNSTTIEENKIVETCAEKMVFEHLVGVTAHELGHNFGLYHNFRGSTDWSNFFTAEEVENIYGVKVDDLIKQPSSSVMDYLDSGSGTRFYPGPYDIAAIRYGYADQVETNRGEFVAIENGTSIEALEQRKGFKSKPYYFCWDRDVDAVGNDPFCQRHDLGTSAQEIVGNYIEKYWNSLVVDRNRYDRNKIPSGMRFSNFYANQYFLRIKSFYDHWRFEISKKIPAQKKYLAGMSPKQYKEMLDKMADSDPKVSTLLHDYLPLRDKIFNFFMDVAFMPNHYCLIRKDDGGLMALEFLQVRDNARINWGVEYAATCADEVLKDYFKANNMELFFETGHPNEDIRFSTLVEDLEDPLDRAGFKGDKLAAVGMMSLRIGDSLKHMNDRFFPNMFDEPDLKEKFVNKFFNRILKGVDLTRDINRIVGDDAPKGSMNFVRYSRERDILGKLYQTFFMGLGVPSNSATAIDQAATERNLDPFLVYITQVPREVEDFPKKIQIGRRYYATQPSSDKAIALMDKYQEIVGELTSSQIDFSAAAEELKKFEAHLPAFASAGVSINHLQGIFDTLSKMMDKVQAGEIEATTFNTLATLFQPEILLHQNLYGQIKKQKEQLVAIKESGQVPPGAPPGFDVDAELAKIDGIINSNWAEHYEKIPADQKPEGLSPITRVEAEARLERMKKEAGDVKMTDEEMAEKRAQYGLILELLQRSQM